MMKHTNAFPIPTFTMMQRKDVPEKRFETRKYFGACLERMGIPKLGTVTYDRNFREIAPGDLVICTTHAGTLNQYLKVVEKVEIDLVTVGTRYADPADDFSFPAAEIYGKVVKVMNEDGVVVWHE